MNAKQTQGPWSARIDETVTIRDSQDNQLGILTHLRTVTGGRRNAGEVAANARLIAAAPDLLAVLENLFNEFGDFEYDVAAISAARAAIAKAKGE